MDEYTDAGGGYRHDEQIGVDIQKDGSAEYKDQNHETQEHHADSKHHGRYIFRYFMRLYPFTFAGKDGMVAVLLYRPPIIPETRVPDSRKTYCFSR